MGQRDVVVVGASAGGVEALRVVVSALPADLPAAVLVVLHIPRSAPGALPAVLGRVTSLRVRAAVDGEALRHGRIYVAPMDRHLLVDGNRVRLGREPAENGYRPAIDPLFRSAAAAFGPRVVGVVLSGARDDGAAGLAEIARRGGATVVQDPADALHPSMPRAALAAVTPDVVAPAGDIGARVEALTREPAPPAASGADPGGLDPGGLDPAGPDPAGPDPAGPDPADATGYRCPVCGDPLLAVDGLAPWRYRCRAGHCWSPESLLDGQPAAAEGALWAALRTLEERAVLARQVAATALWPARRGSVAADAERAAVIVRGLIGDIGGPAGGDEVAPAATREAPDGGRRRDG